MAVKSFLATAWLGLAVLAVTGGREQVRAQGTIRFPAEIEAKIGAEKLKLVRTGSAFRIRGGFKVYAVASYLGRGIKLRTAEQLAHADQPKQLELVFLMTVAGDDMATTFRTILRQNYPEPAFASEVKMLTDLFETTAAKRGDRVWISHVPKVGLHCRREGKEEVLIRNVEFSKAVWDNYLGEYNCGEHVKRGLVSELAPP